MRQGAIRIPPTSRRSPMSEDLLRLAERVEKLEGPDREVDLEIARYRGVTVWKRNDDDTGNDETTHWHYTASRAAAMTLVPRGFCLTAMGDVQDDCEGHSGP